MAAGRLRVVWAISVCNYELWIAYNLVLTTTNGDLKTYQIAKAIWLINSRGGTTS